MTLKMSRKGRSDNEPEGLRTQPQGCLWSFQPYAQKEGELFEYVGPLWTVIAILNFPQNALYHGEKRT